MTPQEQELVNELFDRLTTLEANPRDPDAGRLIADGLRRAPHAVYALVQTALVQDEALKRANARIEELQAQSAGESQQQGGFLDSVRDEILGRRDPRGSVPSVPSQTQSSTAPPYRRQPEYPPQTPPYPPGPGLAPAMGPAFGSGGSFLGTAASTVAGVIGGGLLLNSIRSMFGDHAGLGGHERSALGSSGGSTADSALAQKDRDQDQDQDQDQDDQEQEDQDDQEQEDQDDQEQEDQDDQEQEDQDDQEQEDQDDQEQEDQDDQEQEDQDDQEQEDQDQDDDGGDFGGDDTDSA